MDSRIAAELLYESEATLRMVDDALDELRIADPEPQLRLTNGSAMGLDLSSDTASYAAPSELAVRAYWQVQELLECVRHSRQALQSLGKVEVSATAPVDVDRTLALVDRLDTLDVSATDDRRAMHDELRRDLVSMMNQLEHRSAASDAFSAVALQLAEAEARLTKLGHVFDASDA